MKKILALAILFVFVIAIGIGLIHGTTIDTEVTKQKTKVGFILNGDIDDHSWGESHYNGMEKTAKSLNLVVQYAKNTPESEASEKVIEQLIQDGCKIIICNSFGFGDAQIKMAEKYPEVYFFHATGVNSRRNMSTFFGRVYQMRYLSGIVAGLQTQTNEIGYIAAFPISEVNRGINAFALGVRSVNPKATVHVKFTNTWVEDELTRDVTEEFFMECPNIDVMTLHSDSQAPLQLADEKAIWTIGYNIDNEKLYPNTFLTAPVWAWEKFYEPHILECLQGKFHEQKYWEGLETGIVDLAPLTKNVKEGTQEIVDAEKQKLLTGEFDVFYGPIKDNEGKERIAAGENMSDDVLLNEFDWYVEGVVIHE